MIALLSGDFLLLLVRVGNHFSLITRFKLGHSSLIEWLQLTQ